MMFTTDWAQYGISSEVITGGIAISGLFDLDPLSQTAMNVDLNLDMESVQSLSPIRLTPLVHAPMVVTLGARESSEFHRQGKLIKNAPGWDAVATDPIAFENYHHFNILDPFMDMNSLMWAALRK